MHEYGTAVACEGVGVGVGLKQRGALAEIAVSVADRREHQVQFLTVVAALTQGGVGLDEQDLAVGVLAAVYGPGRVDRRTARGESRRVRLRSQHRVYPAVAVEIVTVYQRRLFDAAGLHRGRVSRTH